MGILWLVVIVIGLIYIYNNYKIDEEDMLGLKLVGYYILGGFQLKIGSFPIPLGFIIFLIAFRPELNKDAKKYATYLGLIGFILGVFSIFIWLVYYYYSYLRINVKNNNAYTLYKEHDLLKCYKIWYYSDVQEKIEVIIWRKRKWKTKLW